MSRPTYETVGGQASESITFSRLLENLRLAAQDCTTLGHLKKFNGDELIGQGFLGIAQLLDLTHKQVTELAMGKLLQ